MGTVLLVGPVRVTVRSLDHCPPHVHAVHRGDGWEARFGFSFADEAVALWDVVPVRGAPALATVAGVATAIAAALRLCRDEWWRVHGPALGTCLVNQVLRGRRISGAAYDLASGTTAVTLDDGTMVILGTGGNA